MSDTAVRGGFRRSSLTTALRRFGAPIGLLILVVVASILSPNFLTESNIRLQLQSFALTTALIGVGQTLVILTGGIDLSVGALMAVASCLGGQLLLRGAPPVVFFAAPLILTTCIGALSGTIVAKARIQPIVVTLAVMIAARGLAQLISGDAVRNLGDEVYGGFATYQLGPLPLLGPIPISVVLAVAIYALTAYLLSSTVAGRYVFAVGGNERAAKLAGIEADRVKIIVYALSGTLAGLAGLLLAAHNALADPINDGVYFELATIAAVVVGGTSLLGGVGGVWRTLTGGLILTVLYALFIQIGLPTQAQLIAQGLIIAGAVILQGGGDA
jgi:ribose/xylose/arabinose/galactoside ABC-type transport system permease subunit